MFGFVVAVNVGDSSVMLAAKGVDQVFDSDEGQHSLP